MNWSTDSTTEPATRTIVHEIGPKLAGFLSTIWLGVAVIGAAIILK